MNDLAQYFPNQNMQRLADDLLNVQSWDAFARRFLLGTGKAANTNATYLTACKQFYDFTDGLHPMQAGTPEWLEQWYDQLPADLNTRAVKVAALKFMYKRIAERFPAYVSPFDIMGEELKAKLNRSKRDESERDALTEREIAGTLAMLRADTSLKGRQDYAFFRFAVTSGLRAAELVGLRWENVTETTEGLRTTFIGKGNKRRTVELNDAGAVRALERAFRARFHRNPRGAEYVLNGLPTGRSKGAGMTKSGIHVRLKAIIARAKAAGIVRANLLVSTHTLRHTYATIEVQNGAPIDWVQRQLGHSSLSTTARYLHSHHDSRPTWSKVTGEAA